MFNDDPELERQHCDDMLAAIRQFRRRTMQRIDRLRKRFRLDQAHTMPQGPTRESSQEDGQPGATPGLDGAA